MDSIVHRGRERAIPEVRVAGTLGREAKNEPRQRLVKRAVRAEPNLTYVLAERGQGGEKKK